MNRSRLGMTWSFEAHVMPRQWGQDYYSRTYLRQIHCSVVSRCVNLNARNRLKTSNIELPLRFESPLKRITSVDPTKFVVCTKKEGRRRGGIDANSL